MSDPFKSSHVMASSQRERSFGVGSKLFVPNENFAPISFASRRNFGRGKGEPACTFVGSQGSFNTQYPKLAVRYSEAFHDRFLIIDDKELYLIGASLKDLGRKCFAFMKLDPGEIPRIKKTAFATS